MKYLAHICYDGSKFNGFQRLKNDNSVQKTIETVLTQINKAPVYIKGAGRTDRNVHALDQCISFNLDNDFSLEHLKYVLNRCLPSSISVTKILKVSDSFHARFSAKKKKYLYLIYCGEKNPFLNSYTYIIHQPIDILKMQDGASLFLGIHNFQNFVSGTRKNYLSEIYDLKIWTKKEMIYIEIEGKCFYRYMVRHIVGSLLMLGYGKITKDDLKEAIFKPEKKKVFFVAPPQGLYLKEINY